MTLVRRALLAALSMSVTACSSAEFASTGIQGGLGVGALLISGEVPRETTTADDFDLQSDVGIGGFVELVLRGETSLHLRVTAGRNEAGVQQAATTVDVRQVMVGPIVSHDLDLSSVVLRPMVGVGFDFVSADFSSPFFEDQSAVALSLLVGLEADVVGGSAIGVSWWSSLFGGGTDASEDDSAMSNLLLYAAVRF